MKQIIFLILLVMFIGGCATTSTLRYPPVRWLTDDDRQPIKKPPERSNIILGIDMDKPLVQLENFVPSTGIPGLSGMQIVGGRGESSDTNNFDEAADSTWFTNRLGRTPISPAEIAKGPNTSSTTLSAGILSVEKVIESKPTPLFMVTDSKGVRYQISFDNSRSPEASTGGGLIASKVLYAAGYNIPETFIAWIEPSRFMLAENNSLINKYGRKEPITNSEIEKMLSSLYKDPKTGFLRILAIREPNGIYIEPFDMMGKRKGDKNDRIPHENRRPLRGLKIFAAYLDLSQINESCTGDYFVSDDGLNGYLMHYIMKYDNAMSDPYEKFDPDSWHTEGLNEAFENMTARDAFWASKILSRFNDKAIEAIANEAHFSDKQKTLDTIAALKQRRDAIVKYWFAKLNTLDNFSLAKDNNTFIVSFDDLNAGMQPETSIKYNYRLRTKKGRAELMPWTETEKRKISIEAPIAETMHKGNIYVLEINSISSGQKWPSPPINIFLKKDRDGNVGIEGTLRR